MIFLALIGLIDSLYLTYDHYFVDKTICPVGSIFSSCGTVLNSKYASIGPIPLALLGVVHYLLLLTWLTLEKKTKKAVLSKVIKLQILAGFIFSLYLVYLQAFVLNAYCFYCLVSAVVSLLLLLSVLKNKK